MKYVFLFILLFLCSFSSISQEYTDKKPDDFLDKYISIIYCGATNQPWAGIVFCNDQSKLNAIRKTYNPMFSYLYINELIYLSLLKYIKSYGKYTSGKANATNLHTYMITTLDGKIKNYYFIHSGSGFEKYFNDIIGIAKKNKCDNKTISILEGRSKWLAK